MRWAWLVILFTALGAAAGTFWPTSGQPPQIRYQAHAVVRTEEGRLVSNSRTVTKGLPGSTAIRSDVQLLAQDETCLLVARNKHLQAAVPWLGGQNLDDVTFQKAVCCRLRNAVGASIEPGTELVQISASGDDSAFATAVANAFAEALVQRWSTPPNGDAAAVKKLQSQVDQSENELKQSAQRRVRWAATIDATGLALRRANLAAHADHEQRLRDDAERARLTAASEVDRLARGLDGGVSHGIEVGRKQRLEKAEAKDELYRAAAAEQISSSKEFALQRGVGKTEQHRDVVIAADRLKNAEEVVAKREKELANAVDADISREKAAALKAMKDEAGSRLKSAEASVADCDKRLVNLNAQLKNFAADRQRQAEAQQQINAIDDELERKSRECDALHERLLALNVAVPAAPPTPARVVQRAESADEIVVNSGTIGRNRWIARVGGPAAGCVLGLLAMLVAGRLDTRLRDASEVEGLLAAPLLACIPLAAIGRKARRMGAEAAWAPVTEAFRSIRTHLLVQNRADPTTRTKTLCITSPRTGDGRSTLAVGLAVSLSKAGRRVLLVDADLRKPSLHRMWKMQQSPGLAELIQGEPNASEAIHPSGLPNLDVLPAGAASVHPAELLSWPDLGRYLSALGAGYDHVLVDSSPLLENTDSHVLLGGVDGVVCAFDKRVKSTEIKQIADLLSRRQANLVGTVVNRVAYRLDRPFNGTGRINPQRSVVGSSKSGSFSQNIQKTG